MPLISLSKGQQSEVSIGYVAPANGHFRDKLSKALQRVLQRLIVTVRGENDGPEAENDTATTTENASVK